MKIIVSEYNEKYIEDTAKKFMQRFEYGDMCYNTRGTYFPTVITEINSSEAITEDRGIETYTSELEPIPITFRVLEELGFKLNKDKSTIKGYGHLYIYENQIGPYYLWFRSISKTEKDESVYNSYMHVHNNDSNKYGPLTLEIKIKELIDSKKDLPVMLTSFSCRSQWTWESHTNSCHFIHELQHVYRQYGFDESKIIEAVNKYYGEES